MRQQAAFHVLNCCMMPERGHVLANSQVLEDAWCHGLILTRVEHACARLIGSKPYILMVLEDGRSRSSLCCMYVLEHHLT
jgi:hypothetical protein